MCIVNPQDEKTFALACTSLDVDIIVVESAGKLPYIPRIPAIRTAISRGVHFELNLGPSLRDASARRYLFANAAMFVRVTKGRNIIVSGDARHPADLRAPNDIANLCSLFGLDFAIAKATLSSAPAAIIKRGEARKMAGGVIRVVENPPLTTTTTSTITPMETEGGSGAEAMRF